MDPKEVDLDKVLTPDIADKKEKELNERSMLLNQ